jgi:hypothetical protein
MFKVVTIAILRISLVSVTLCVSSTCNSQEKFALGVGGDSCPSYTSHVIASLPKITSRAASDNREELQSAIYLEWLLGFISGYNATLTDPTARVQADVAAVDRYVRWWCGQNRSGNISLAVQQYLKGDVP